MPNPKHVQERRKSQRFQGDHYPLRVGRRSARLVNWSAVGIGVQVREGLDGYTLGDRVSISIHSESTLAVAAFAGFVRRIDEQQGILGIEFDEGAAEIVPLLVELFGMASADS